jgi:ABC-type phosphate transport system substrate-binding protein
MRTFIAFALLGSVLAATTLVQGQETPAYRVIVNPKNSVTSVERRFLAHAFLKKTTTWRDGEGIRPVDLPPDSSVRRRFTEDVLGRSVAAVKSYWQQMIFGGHNVPPPELDSDEEVVRFVLRHAGAVGYVSAGANLMGARVLTLK